MSLAALVDEKELAEMLGTEDKAKQKRKLKENGIRFIRGVNGHFSVTWYDVCHPAGKRPAANDIGTDEPDWGAMDNGKKA